MIVIETHIFVFSLLNTLGENDYVNVAGFTENATWVTPCLGEGLVQANARNKRLLFDGIDQLNDRAIAYFGKALEFAYEKLENFEDNRGSNQDGAGRLGNFSLIVYKFDKISKSVSIGH